MKKMKKMKFSLRPKIPLLVILMTKIDICLQTPFTPIFSDLLNDDDDDDDVKNCKLLSRKEGDKWYNIKTVYLLNIQSLRPSPYFFNRSVFIVLHHMSYLSFEWRTSLVLKKAYHLFLTKAKMRWKLKSNTVHYFRFHTIMGKNWTKSSRRS